MQTYSFPGAEEGNLRFTTTTDTFCIISLARPGSVSSEEISRIFGNEYSDSTSQRGKTRAVLSVTRPVPLLLVDSVTLLGGTGEPLPWWHDGAKLHILVEAAELDRVQLAWAFEIRYA